MRELSPKQRVFIAEYLKTSNGTQAAKIAGYAEPQNSATDLLRNPLVKAELEKTYKQLQIKSGYNIQAAMAETDDVITFAKETGNANAYVKAVELKAKLNGLLIEKHKVEVSGFQVIVGGIDFTKRDGKSEEPVETDVTDTGEDLFGE